MPRAQGDIDHILLTSGSEWFSRFERELLTLQAMPRRCAVAPILSTARREVRQLLCGKGHHIYWVYFSIAGEVVRILHLRHSARKPLKRL